MATQATKRPADDQEEFARLTLEGMGTLGDTYAHYNGEKINVFGGIEGEEVVVRVIRYRRRRKRFLSGIVTEVLKPSPHRIKPPCPYFGQCTGCQWQHIDYSHQLRMKQAAVERELIAYPTLRTVSVLETIPSEEIFNYRNHARFTVRNGASIVFTNRLTRRFVRIDECMLMNPEINQALRQLQDRCGETRQLSIRYGVSTGDMLIQPTMHSQEITVPTGQTHYREKLLGRTFRVASPSFFQVNTRQAERLVELVRDSLNLTGDEVLVDAYAGVGTFAVLLAPFVKHVIAIEESLSAIKDAGVNTLGIENLEFLHGKTEDVMGNLEKAPDAVILDPPRIGCHPKVLETLIRRAPGKIVYVSCDPEALARDLDILVNRGFKITTIAPIDMFPHTHHIETVVALKYGEQPCNFPG